MTNVLGIDYGAKRVGVALADSEAGIARPLTTLTADSDLPDKLRHLVVENQARTLVVGLPRNLDGEDTAQTAAARQFARTLQNLFHLPVVLQDEALTSAEAERRLRAHHHGKIPSGPPAGRTGLVDATAAAIILQDYLDSL